MKKEKTRIKKQLVFNCISILIVFSIGFYYLGRLIYYKIDSEKEIVYSNILAEHLIEQEEANPYESNNNLIKLNGIYRYVGNVDNNYVKYKGFLWRVVKINSDNSITMITEDNITSLPQNESLEKYILAWLNDKDEKYTGIFENSLELKENEVKTNKICLDSFKDIENASCFNTNNDYKIGILSVYDYIEANANESYLNNGNTFWTSNRGAEDEAWFVAEDGRLGTSDLSSKLGVRPVITIDGNSKIISGDGTLDNPYNIDGRKIEIINDAYVGSYISYNDTLWKVVSKEKDKVKIVSEECLKDSNGECLEKEFAQYTNEINLNAKDQLITYLNKTYYKTLEHPEYITSGKFYIGNYSLIDNNYQSCFEDYENLKVGILSAAEIFAYELENTFLLTTSKNNELSIYTVNSNHGLYENMINEKANVRPSLYFKSNITITDGDGSYLYPYQLGGIK